MLFLEQIRDLGSSKGDQLSTIGGIASVNGGGVGVVISSRTVSQNQDGSETVSLRIQHQTDAGDIYGPGVIVGPETLALAAEASANADNNVNATAETQALDPLNGARDPIDRFSQRSGSENQSADDLSAEEKAVVDEMRSRDQSVRQEEKAHAAMAGDMAGAIQYEYAVGPDGRRYVVNGSVPISTGSAATPEQAARDGARLAAAAHAAINPSAADLAAARQGYAAIQQAQSQGEQAFRVTA